MSGNIVAKNNTRLITVICCLYIFQGLFCMTLFTPSMPAITEHFMTTNTSVKLSITWYLFSYGLSQLLYGPLSDKHGRKPIVIIALVIMIIGNMITVWSWNITVFIVGHAVAGFGAGAGSTLTRAIIQESNSKKDFAKTLSWVMISATLGTNSGPVIGGILQQYFGWQSCFYLLIIMALALLVFILRFLPETNQHKKGHQFSKIVREYRYLTKDKTYLAHALIIALIFGLSISYYTMTPFLYQKILGVSPQTNGLLTTFIVFTIFVGAVIFNRTVHSYPTKVFFIIGMSCFSIASLAIMLFGFIGLISIFAILLPGIILFFGLGLSNTLFTSEGLQKHRHHAGLAGALQGSIKVLGAFVIGLFVSHLSETSLLPLGVILCVISSLIIALYLWSVK